MLQICPKYISTQKETHSTGISHTNWAKIKARYLGKKLQLTETQESEKGLAKRISTVKI